MNVTYINPFVSSTIQTFRTMLNAELRPLAPMLKKAPFPTYDISGVIGLSGEAQGLIALAFPEIVAVKSISSMLGFPITRDSEELIDGIGEVVNIVAGYAKKDLTQFSLTISLPNVIIGKKHTVTVPSGTMTIIVPFESTFGQFNMEVALVTP